MKTLLLIIAFAMPQTNMRTIHHLNVCKSQATPLPAYQPGGIWSCIAGSIATIGGNTIYGITAGIQPCTYTFSDSIYTTEIVVVDCNILDINTLK